MSLGEGYYKITFSVIIPSYNRAGVLINALNSVIEQTYTNWECLVIDDGSTDSTSNLVNSFKDKRIRYFYKENGERSAARNYGIDRAEGLFICFLDSDDIFFANHMEELNKVILTKDVPVGLFSTGMNENSPTQVQERPKFDPDAYRHPIFYIWQNFMLPSSVCVHRNILKKNKFPEKFNVWEDTHLWLRIVANFPFFQINKVTTQWNLHEDSSVARAFTEITANHVKNYLSCISDLFYNYSEVLRPYLNDIDRVEYQFKKFRMFYDIAYSRKEYTTCFKLYIVGASFFHFKDLNLFVYKKTSNKIKCELRTIKQKLWRN